MHQRLLGLAFSGITIVILLAMAYVLAPYAMGLVLKAQLGQIRAMMDSPEQIAKCQQIAAPEFQDAALFGINLQFTDHVHYIVSLMCLGEGGMQVRVKDGTLPLGTTRVPGSPGLRFVKDGPYKTQFDAQIFGSRFPIVFEQGQMEDGTAPELKHPQSMCASWGYTCCDGTQGAPKGASAGSLPVDCPNTCFEQCVTRPVLKVHGSGAGYSPTIRTFSLRSPTTSATLSLEGSADITRTIVEFGDNLKQEFRGIPESVTHAYTCDAAPCVYTLKVIGYNSNGIENIENADAQLEVRILE